MLSDRIRPNSEAAPWVVDEVKAIEARGSILREALERIAANRYGLQGIFGDHPEESIDKYYAAYKYCLSQIENIQFIARDALLLAKGGE